MSIRLGVIADPHVSVDRDEPAAWHNPFRLVDAHDRLQDALSHPLIAGCVAVVVLGDLAHFGERRSMRRVVDIVASDERPALLLSGNHDVLDDGVRLEHEVEARGAPSVTSPLARDVEGSAFAAILREAGLSGTVHEVTALTSRAVQPFDVVERTLTTSALAAHVVLSHFPPGSFESRCRHEQLLYAGHLEQLAPTTGLHAAHAADGPRPTVALSGHLHLRGTAVDGALLQLSFAALVEPPYEVAAVDIEVDPALGTLRVGYECASVIPPDAGRLPVLDPPAGCWGWDGAWTALDVSRPTAPA
jgi:hypothetical protein